MAISEQCKVGLHFAWGVLTPGIKSPVILFLVCCFDTKCSHPLCFEGIKCDIKWFESGPSVSYLPLPIPDPVRCYGNQNCEDCKGSFCYGHFMKPHDTFMSALPPMCKPPSVILKDYFDAMDAPSESDLNELSKQVMLPVDEIRIWFDHLHTIRDNHRKGASKAAETRRKNNQKSTISHPVIKESNYQCGVCHSPYQAFTECEEKWIECENCDTWYHFACVGIVDEPETYPVLRLCLIITFFFS